MDLHTEVTRQLLRLTSEGGTANRLLLDTPRGWVQVLAQRDAPAVQIEVSAGKYLPEGATLAVEGEQALWDRGFRRNNRAVPFGRSGTLAGSEDAERLAAEVLAILEQVFPGEGEVPPPQLDLLLGDAPTTVNNTLHDRMVALSKDRAMATRQKLYATLVQSELLLALKAPYTGDPGIGADLPLRRFGELSGAEVVGVFTDWEHLRNYDPRLVPWVAVPGEVLFPLLSARRVASVLINAGGGVARGELYRNEIDALSDWLAARAARH
jgi:hypothetical protein